MEIKFIKVFCYQDVDREEYEEPNPKYKVTRDVQDGTVFISKDSTITLLGFSLSECGDSSPFKTLSGDVIRVPNDAVVKL